MRVSLSKLPVLLIGFLQTDLKLLQLKASDFYDFTAQKINQTTNPIKFSKKPKIPILNLTKRCKLYNNSLTSSHQQASAAHYFPENLFPKKNF